MNPKKKPLKAKAPHKQGTSERHSTLTRRCRHLRWDLRHLDSAIMAVAFARDLVPVVDAKPASPTVTALYTSAVIHYGRIFTRTRAGNQMREKPLRREPQFDGEVHEALLRVRDKVTAHSDDDAAPTDFTVFGRRLSGQSFALETASEVVIRATGLAGPKDRPTAERIRDHIEGVVDYLIRVVREEATRIGAEAAGDLGPFIDAMKAAGVKPVEHGSVDLQPDASRTIKLPDVPVPGLKEPVKEVRPDLHVYRCLQLRVRPKVRVPLPCRPGEFVELNSQVSDEEVVLVNVGLVTPS